MKETMAVLNLVRRNSGNSRASTELRCPSLKFMFVLFIIISTWALLSAGSLDIDFC